MRADLRLLALSLIFAVAAAGAAEDPALDSSSPLKRRTAAISELSVQELEQKARAGRSGDGDGEQIHAGASKHKAAADRPVYLVEIGGSGKTLFATFQLADGRLAEFVPGQTVPGFGRILAILPLAVQRDDKHFFSPETME